MISRSVRRTTLLLAALVLTLGALVGTPAAPASAAVTVYPVPTSAAGLSRIVTAPDGNMWFVERDVNKIGRITPAGAITEYNLPPTTTGTASVMDLDIAPDGSLWVVYDQGWHAVHITDPTGSGNTNYSLGGNPYGGAVRVDPSGTAWITMNYDESGIAVVTPGSAPSWPANAPECDDVLGEARDGTMWCAKDGGVGSSAGLTHVSPGATGGTTYPLGLADAQQVSSLAAGPTGSIWFTSYYQGAWGIGTGNGEVGYVDRASGAKTSWRTGSRTAPTSLVAGPDGDMWFTMSAGGAKGIGHISPGGVGVVSAVGNYQPTSMTFGADGAVWFTDSTNNSIVRVTTDQLRANTVDLGSGVTMTVDGGRPIGNPLATGKVKGKQVAARGRKLVVPVSCPKAAPGPCAGTASVETRRATLTKARTFQVKPGRTKQVKVKLNKSGARQLAKKRRLKATAVLSGGGYATTKKVKVVRR